MALAWGSDGSISGIFGFGSTSQLHSIKYYDALRVAQNTTVSCLVICVIAWSFPFLQHYHSLRNNIRCYINIIWIFAVFLVIFLQVVFMFAMINVSVPQFFIWNAYLLLAPLIFAFIILIMEFYLKKRYRTWFRQEQQFMSLEFNTKLGMYSPVSPF